MNEINIMPEINVTEPSRDSDDESKFVSPNWLITKMRIPKRSIVPEAIHFLDIPAPFVYIIS